MASVVFEQDVVVGQRPLLADRLSCSHLSVRRPGGFQLSQDGRHSSGEPGFPVHHLVSPSHQLGKIQSSAVLRESLPSKLSRYLKSLIAIYKNMNMDIYIYGMGKIWIYI